jgi:hypothetical protein
MPDLLPPLHCDEDVSVVLAAMLRARGFTATTARDSGQLGAIGRGTARLRRKCRQRVGNPQPRRLRASARQLARCGAAPFGHHHRPAATARRARPATGPAPRSAPGRGLRGSAVLRVTPNRPPESSWDLHVPGGQVCSKPRGTLRGFGLPNRWHSWWHLSVTVSPTRSHWVTERQRGCRPARCGIRAMECDRARLIATDRPRPFRFENLGS